jgi:hypothetical protein
MILESNLRLWSYLRRSWIRLINTWGLTPPLDRSVPYRSDGRSRTYALESAHVYMKGLKRLNGTRFN